MRRIGGDSLIFPAALIAVTAWKHQHEAIFGSAGVKFPPMTCAEFLALVAERRESYSEVFQSVVTGLINAYGCVGIKKDVSYSFPIFDRRPTPADIHRLACAYSDMAHVANNTLALCTFFAPSGGRISITQSIMAENVVLNIRMDGELSEDDRTATERFIMEDRHLVLGNRVSGATFVESGTERHLSTSVTYCENDVNGRRRKAVKRAQGKKAKTASA